METLKRQKVSDLIDSFQLAEAECILLQEHQQVPGDDEVCYLLGNINRKRSNWKEALQWYAHAIEMNAESPALQAREMLVQIMDFYDKDRYNV